VKAAAVYFKAMAGFVVDSGLQQSLSLYTNTELLLALLAAVIGATPLAALAAEKLHNVRLRGFAPLAEAVFIALVLLASFASLASSTFSPFIYQQF